MLDDVSVAPASDKVSEIVARIERLPMTVWQVKARALVGIATFFSAFDLFSLVVVLPALIPLWHIKMQNIGLLFTASAAGQFVGAIVLGRMAERYGRLKMARVSVVFYGLLSFACAASWNYASLFVFLFIQGIGIGAQPSISGAYISEVAKAKGRGRFFMPYQLVFPMGLLFGSITGLWIVPSLGWRAIFIIGGFVSVMFFVLRFYLPESPRWLASVGRYEQAEKAMTFIEERVRKAHGGDLPQPNFAAVATTPARSTSYAELFSGFYLRRTLNIWVMWFAVYFTILGLMMVLPSVYRLHFNLSLHQALLYGVIFQIVQVIGGVLATFLVDIVGRRLWTGLSFILAAASYIAIWLGGATSALQVLVLASIGTCLLGGTGILLFLYTSEIYPTRLRALGSSLGTAWVAIAASVGPLMIGFVTAHYRLSWNFLVFALVNIAAAILIMSLGVETKGKVLEQVSP